jgi:anaerobic selenocysteine-containing dehydrogenase
MRTIVHGTCHHDCPDSCGWQVTVEDGRAVQLRGNAAHPYNQGDLCPKVTKFLDRVYSPDRVTTPLRRIGAKGEGCFVPITWDEALEEVAARFHEVIARHGPEAILPYSDAGNQSLLAMGFTERFWNRLGASRLVRAVCGPTAGAGVAMTNGGALALDPLELRHSKLILLWGTNTKLTNRHLWPTIEAARADGAQVVVIDPMRTLTAEDADWFLQPLPGTDIALMLAIMHVLVRDDLVDHAWVADHTSGYAELAAHVADWTPTRAATECGLDTADIERLAQLYGTVRPTGIRTLIGAEHHENGAMFFRTLACLPALVGDWQYRGGGLARSVGSWTSLQVDSAALEGHHLLGGHDPRWLNMSRLGRILTGDDPDAVSPPVEALFVWNCNPLVTIPNTELIRRGLQRDDLFTVVHDQFVTDTARYADIVLPATTQIEAVDVVPAWGHLWLGWNEPAVAPVGESVSNSELFRRLAGAMGFTEPELFEDDLAVLARALPSIDLEALRRDGFTRMPYPDDGRPYGDGVFPTADGRVQLLSPALGSIGQPTLPTYVRVHEGPHGPDADRFPITLLTPKTHQRFLNSGYAHLPRHGGAEGGPFLELSAGDAAGRGLVDGDLARVWNERAEAMLPVRVSRRVRDGVAAIPFGWWSAHTGNGVVANSFTNDTLTEWGGGVAYNDTLVQVEPAC